MGVPSVLMEGASVESSFLFRQRFTPHKLSKDNRPIVLLFFLMFLPAKDIWCNIHVFQRGEGVRGHHEHHNKQNNDNEENTSWFAILPLQLLQPYTATCEKIIIRIGKKKKEI